MKKYVLLFLVLISFNIAAMEAPEVEMMVTENAASIESIDDELLIEILRIGVCTCIAVDNDGKINLFEFNDLAKASGKALDFFGNIQLVSKRFKGCIDYIIRLFAILELDDVLLEIGENRSDLTPEYLESLPSLSPTIKVKALDFMIKRYKGWIALNREAFGLKNPAIDSFILSKSSLNKKLKRLFLKKNRRLKDIKFINDKEIEFFCNKIIVLLAEGANPNLVVKFKFNTHIRRGTLLFIAIKVNKCPDLVRFLLFRSAYLFEEMNFNYVDSKGQTPLTVALLQNNYYLAKDLLVRGADAKIRSRDGKSLLMTAINYCKDFEVLLASGILNLLVEKGAEINAQDDQGRTALLLAILKENSELVIEFLINNGARLNDLVAVYRWGNIKRSVLAWSVCCLKEKVVQMLLEKGADINSWDSEGESIIEYAYNFGQQMKRSEYYNEEEHKRFETIWKMLKDKVAENPELDEVSFCVLS